MNKDDLVISVRAISPVEVCGWFPNDARQVWVEVSVGDQKAICRLELPAKREGVA
jgi:hypothetical protein